MPTSRTARIRLFQVVLATLTVLAGVFAFGTTASAHHALITGEAGCGGVVKFTGSSRRRGGHAAPYR